MTGSAAHLRIIEETPAYWRVVFDNPPLNIMGATIFEGLQVSLPPVDRLLDGLNSFTTALTWPESQRRFQALSDRGLGKPGEMENRFGELLGTLLET